MGMSRRSFVDLGEWIWASGTDIQRVFGEVGEWTWAIGCLNGRSARLGGFVRPLSTSNGSRSPKTRTHLGCLVVGVSGESQDFSQFSAPAFCLIMLIRWFSVHSLESVE